MKKIKKELSEFIAEYKETPTPKHKMIVRRLIRNQQKRIKIMQNTLKQEKIMEKKAEKGDLHSEVLAMKKLQKDTKTFIKDMQRANKKLKSIIGK
jgi:hypothetical protein